MEKFELNNESVHTVQIDGKDVEVVPKETVSGILTKANETVEQTSKQIEEASKKGQTELKRDLSKKLGINLFEEKEVESFIEGLKNKVDRTELNEKEKRLEELTGIEEKYKDLQVDLVLTKENINDNYKERAKQLVINDVNAKNISYEEAVKNVVKEMPFLTRKPNGRAGADFNSDPNGKTGYETYVEDKYKNNPYYKK